MMRLDAESCQYIIMYRPIRGAEFFRVLQNTRCICRSSSWNAVRLIPRLT